MKSEIGGRKMADEDLEEDVSGSGTCPTAAPPFEAGLWSVKEPAAPPYLSPREQNQAEISKV